MSSTDPRSEETLFATALAMPETARAPYLDQACGGDATLRASVEALLRAHLAANGFLPSVPGITQPIVATTSRVEEQPGDWIGRYKLLQKIGEGGCGAVYMAEQEEPIRRRVALKVIKLGMDTKAVVARFDAERQALAMMDHPNIAKVFDAGATESGRPFFVMELVRGIPVTKYCDEHSLATERRLELFTQICQAIQHAHQKGIIHRDIKPSNILVTLHDGTPVPKVIDFGIAKATQGKLTDHTYFTAFEQFIGTPAYMSPEQAEMSGLDVDTRSDIYSLGVLLYELLAGRPPFDPKTFRAAGIDEMRRIIREVDPPKPSARLSTLTDGDQTTVAKLRGMVPAQLSFVLAGDLDWIVMRCLEKDRARRYATPSELVADIERHLRNEPVIARPPSTHYLLRKLMRRHKVGFAAGAAVALSLIAGLVISSALLVRERRVRQRAVVAERFMKEMLMSAGPNRALGQDTTLLQKILDSTARRIGTDLVDQPAIAADFRETIGEVYLELGRHAKEAEPLLRAAVEGHRAASGNRSADKASSLTLLGMALGQLNRYSEAEAALEEALAIRREIYGPEHPLFADTLAQLAAIPGDNRSREQKVAMLNEVLAIHRKAFGAEHTAVAATLHALGEVARQEVDHATAMRLHEEALAIRRHLLGNEHPDTAASLDVLGYLYAHDLERKTDAATIYAEAFNLRRKFLGDAHPDTVISLLHLTGQMPAREVAPETRDLVREFVARHRKEGSVLLAPLLLVQASMGTGVDPEAAQTRVQEAQLILERSQKNGAPLGSNVVRAMYFFGWSKFISNVPDEGLVMAEEARKLAPTVFRSVSSDLNAFLTAHILGWIYLGLGRESEAAAMFEDAFRQPKRAKSLPMWPVDMAALGECYRATNRTPKAREYLTTALASLETDRTSPHAAFVRAQLGLTLLREGRFAEAETTLRKALQGYDDPGIRPLHRRLQPPQRVKSGLGQALAAQGKFADAEPFVVEALQELQANEQGMHGNRSAMVREAFDAVIALYTAWGKPAQAAEWKTKFGDAAAPASQASLPAKKI